MPRNLSRNREPETPSNTLVYFFREAVRRIIVSKRTSFVAIGMIAISLVIMGLFLLVAENLERTVKVWEGRSRVTVYFAEDATPQQIGEVDRQLAARAVLAKRHQVSRDEALTRFKTLFPAMTDIAGELDGNPFPPSIEIEAPPAIARTTAFQREVDAISRMPGVDEVAFDWQWVDRLERLVYVVNVSGAVVGGILAIAAAFTIANVIRLTMMLYREEIEIMRLVGATERIIRGPYLIEGILQGTIGGLLAAAILFGSWTAARNSLAQASSLLWGFLFSGFLPWQKVAALVAGGTIAGWFGSWLSVRETTES